MTARRGQAPAIPIVADVVSVKLRAVDFESAGTPHMQPCPAYGTPEERKINKEQQEIRRLRAIGAAAADHKEWICYRTTPYIHVAQQPYHNREMFELYGARLEGA
ncbi:hypothetical protein M422DRAFT_275956 [Sphaerobolus stellatus SS14]|uniref:Uncharacterized protein n=1 Tax=Sphaerobolus stellatus (strain SS14) TaxID=990650 RepID=A0A0C9UE76_SPHS4|nr:hypothetical protein M422DRAFT_275956 [Sphaerobolus stellatus SS14]